MQNESAQVVLGRHYHISIWQRNPQAPNPLDQAGNNGPTMTFNANNMQQSVFKGMIGIRVTFTTFITPFHRCSTNFVHNKHIMRQCSELERLQLLNERRLQQYTKLSALWSKFISSIGRSTFQELKRVKFSNNLALRNEKIRLEKCKHQLCFATSICKT